MTSIILGVPVDGMTEVLQVEVASEEVNSDLVLAGVEPGRIAARAVTTLEESLDALQPALRSICSHLLAIAPADIQIEFGLKFGGETGIILTKGTAEVNLKVSMTWRRNSSSG